jgi:hypothetical protein
MSLLSHSKYELIFLRPFHKVLIVFADLGNIPVTRGKEVKCGTNED